MVGINGHQVNLLLDRLPFYLLIWIGSPEQMNHGAYIHLMRIDPYVMMNKTKKNRQRTSKRVALTARLSLKRTMQLQNSTTIPKKNRKIPALWKLLDAAIIAYARQKESISGRMIKLLDIQP